jgi:nitroimidazol reductase NimA-like FMN-containing flavoprotein (pyridoxamine 5'-phosphate oxidase superfamily)
MSQQSQKEDAMSQQPLPTDHAGLVVLPLDESLDRIRRARLGRLAILHNGEPVILPVNHEMDGDAIIFRTAIGTKLDAAFNQAPVSFEVDGYDPDRRTGWSVVVRGMANVVDEPGEVARLSKIGVSPWADAVERNNWVRVTPYEITGRQIVHAAAATVS